MKSLVHAVISLLLVLPIVAAPMIGRAQTVEPSATTSSVPVFVCGGTHNGVAITCTGTGTGGTTKRLHAPEIDIQFAVSGLVLIFGCLAILRGSKRL
jgi:hypothetical protein